MRVALASLSSLVLITSLPAQDRLFRPTDHEARMTVAKELRSLSRQERELLPLIGLAGVIGSRLRSGSLRRRRTDRDPAASAFWPLLQHTKSNDIARTAPVQMDWHVGNDRQPAQMAFLYGSTATKPGSTARNVEAVDIKPVPVRPRSL